MCTVSSRGCWGAHSKRVVVARSPQHTTRDDPLWSCAGGNGAELQQKGQSEVIKAVEACVRALIDGDLEEGAGAAGVAREVRLTPLAVS